MRLRSVQRIPWLLLSAGLVLLLAVPLEGALKPPSLKTTTTSTTTTTASPKAEDDVQEEPVTESSHANKSSPNLTGIPQKDYVFDPNLPRELNGKDLSDYPFYSGLPENITFPCEGLKDGFYASVEHKCQVYHHCLFGTRYDFLCANYTAFDQRTFICHFVSEVDCENSPKYFDRNEALYKATTTTTLAPPSRAIYERLPPADGGRRGAGAGVGPPPRRRRPYRRRRPVYEYYYDDEEYDQLQDEEYYEDEPSPSSSTTQAPPKRRRKKPKPSGSRANSAPLTAPGASGPSGPDAQDAGDNSGSHAAPKVRAQGLGSVFSAPRIPPRVRRPVPLSERDKFDYSASGPQQSGSSGVKATAASTTPPPSTTAASDYYDDEVEEEIPAARPKHKRPASKRRPESVEVDDEYDDYEEEPRRPLRPAPPRRRKPGRRQPPRRYKGESSEYEDEESEEESVPVRPAHRSQHKRKRVEDSAPVPSSTTPKPRPKPRKPTPTPSAEPPPEDDEEYYYDDELPPEPSPSTPKSTTYRTRVRSSTSPPRTTSTTPSTPRPTEAPVLEVTEESAIQPPRSGRRPFLPSRGGSQTLPRGLQPLGAKAKTTSPPSTTSTTSTVLPEISVEYEDSPNARPYFAPQRRPDDARIVLDKPSPRPTTPKYTNPPRPKPDNTEVIEPVTYRAQFPLSALDGSNLRSRFPGSVITFTPTTKSPFRVPFYQEEIVPTKTAVVIRTYQDDVQKAPVRTFQEDVQKTLPRHYQDDRETFPGRPYQEETHKTPARHYQEEINKTPIANYQTEEVHKLPSRPYQDELSKPAVRPYPEEIRKTPARTYQTVATKPPPLPLEGLPKDDPEEYDDALNDALHPPLTQSRTLPPAFNLPYRQLRSNANKPTRDGAGEGVSHQEQKQPVYVQEQQQQPTPTHKRGSVHYQIGAASQQVPHFSAPAPAPAPAQSQPQSQSFDEGEPIERGYFRAVPVFRETPYQAFLQYQRRYQPRQPAPSVVADYYETY